LVIVAAKIPKAVICLVSALSFHEITTHFARGVQILLPRGSHAPVLDYPPIQVHSAVRSAYEIGQVENIQSTFRPRQKLMNQAKNKAFSETGPQKVRDHLKIQISPFPACRNKSDQHDAEHRSTSWRFG